MIVNMMVLNFKAIQRPDSFYWSGGSVQFISDQNKRHHQPNCDGKAADFGRKDIETA